MSPRSVLVVGSGPSGVHFATSALRRGFEVTLVDVGGQGAPARFPNATFAELRAEIDDPAEYFLGSALNGLVLPNGDQEYYGIPPSKQYVFEPVPAFGFTADGFEPLFSFARGGLAEAWTAGCYPLNEAELAPFPITYQEIEPYYDEIARRIGITGEADDLTPFVPLHQGMLPPLNLDPHSVQLMDRYRRKKHLINGRYQAFLGRTRVATLSTAHDGREECAYLGRCLWGCPRQALYTPSQTLRQLESTAGFRYVAGVEALYFRLGDSGLVSALVGRTVAEGREVEFPLEHLVLAAGTLGSAALVLRSMRQATGEVVALGGLMDNRQILLPFLNIGMLGQAAPSSSYQYHLLGMGLAGPTPAEYVHGQLTTLKTALMHPIIQGLPYDLKTSTAIARVTRSALGVLNVNFHDTRREDNTVSLTSTPDLTRSRLRIRYRPAEDEPGRVRQVLRRLRMVLRQLGCIVPPGMLHIRPMGASVHYAGTFPMTASGGRWTSTPACQSRAFPNLTFADGSTLPFLPAKNLTFTLMANAARVADLMPE